MSWRSKQAQQESRENGFSLREKCVSVSSKAERSDPQFFFHCLFLSVPFYRRQYDLSIIVLIYTNNKISYIENEKNFLIMCIAMRPLTRSIEKIITNQ